MSSCSDAVAARAYPLLLTDTGAQTEAIPFDRSVYRVSDPIASISGYTDYNPQEMTVMSTWLQSIPEVYRSYGYTGIVLRPLEYAENLLKKGGLDKQIFGVSRLQDGSLTKYGLPFDRTVPMALFIANHYREISFPYKRWDINYSYRGEHAKAGRYRAFFQADNDIVDKKLTFRADAESIATMIKALESIGIRGFHVYLNHISVAKAFIRAAGVPDALCNDVLRIIDKLKPDNRAEVIVELRETVPGFGEAAAEELLASMSYQGPLSEFTAPLPEGGDVGFTHLVNVERMCIAMGVTPGTILLDLKLTRGLDYYTGIVFESFIEGREVYGSIASGGRYSDLVDGFSGVSTGLEGVGASIGLTRLFDVMKAEGVLDLSKQTTAPVFVGYRTLAEGCFEKALEVAKEIRAAGIDVEFYVSETVRVKNQLTLCNNKGIPFAVMVMNPDEIIIKELILGDAGQIAHTSTADVVATLKGKGL